MGSDKKLLESLRAFRRTDVEHLELLIIGSLDDEVRTEAERLLAELPNAHYLGWMEASALLDHLCAADVYLQPGSQSAIMQNALSARCAVILDDVPSHEPFVDGNGWLLTADRTIESVLRDLNAHPEPVRAMSRRSLVIATELLDYRKLAARIYR